MKITPLKDGNFLVNKNDVFEPLVKGVRKPGLRMAVQPFLIETQLDLILLDTGLGWVENGERVLLQNLEASGYDVWDITKVLISHLHTDHIEGIIDQNGEIMFPNAEIFIQEDEMEYGLSRTEDPSYHADFLRQLIDKPKIIWMNESDGYISPEIQFEVTGGHTPHHQIFWVKDGDETIFYGGDDLPHSSYLDFPVAFRIDYDGHKSMELRKQWEKTAKEENWKILLYHDIRHTVLKLE